MKKTLSTLQNSYIEAWKKPWAQITKCLSDKMNKINTGRQYSLFEHFFCISLYRGQNIGHCGLTYPNHACS